ncbi:ATP-dependent DNA ligase [Staphylococcus equorum]|uniref:ATP-dependent DNA ligase n=1 Tax=Staphylococcus equorum TaxID=246432 RepID=A0A9X4R1V5_9STAP|nr:ATP-dependent DNA ligase [Staphylococcus equorum]MDG0860307.1 ATP-dependent DNA ligase [Staphylococcus equorum]
MEEYINIINDIKEVNSRLEKEKILLENKDNTVLKEIFKFVYDPMVVTGISKKKIEKDLPISKATLEIKDIIQLMKFIKLNNTGKDQVLIEIKNYLSNLNEDLQEFVKNIVIKDLPIGISKTTLNKVYGKDFISKYSVMLAGKYDRDKTDLSKGFSISLKLDGNRVTAFNYESGVQFFSRSGKTVKGLVELEKEFERLPKGMVYDGELIAENKDNLESKELFNLTQTIVRTKGTKSGLSMILFDLLPIEEFKEGKSKQIYQDRLADLETLFRSVSQLNKIKMVPTLYVGDDVSKIDYFLDMVMAKGEEGLMINLSQGYYETKRSKSILKVKEFTTLDLKCIGIKEDIRGSKCGSITVDYKGYTVDVSGLKEKDKQGFWSNPESVIGKIVEVKFKDESTNASGGLSLRHPNFIRIREDKDEVSYV